MTGQLSKSGLLAMGKAMLVALAAALLVQPATAQMRSIDPDTAYEVDGDLAGESTAAPTYEDRTLDLPPEAPAEQRYEVPQTYGTDGTQQYPAEAAAQAAQENAADSAPSGTYQQDDLLGAAEGVFGQGAEGLAGLIEDLLRDQGEPNGYIVGREGGGAFIFGVRYGSGTLYHKVEGQKPVYWTGPSVGFDVGANAGSTFILVYNLYDTEDLYERFPAGEGQLYALGGFNASYVRKGDIVLIPIRVGGGLRVGINAGYLKFSKEQDWLPF